MLQKNTLLVGLLTGLLSVSSLALAEARSVNADLLTVSSDGKKITFMDGGNKVKSKISGSRTTIKINGAASDRENLKVGMNCDLAYETGGKNEPSMLDCK